MSDAKHCSSCSHKSICKYEKEMHGIESKLLVVIPDYLQDIFSATVSCTHSDIQLLRPPMTRNTEWDPESKSFN